MWKREEKDKYCTTWLVGGATGGQGGTFQLFALSPSCSVGRGVCKKEFKEVSNAFWLPQAQLHWQPRLGVEIPQQNFSTSHCYSHGASFLCWPSPLGSWGQGCVHDGNQSKRRDFNLISFQPLTRAVNTWERLLIKWDKRWSHLP